MKWLNHLDYKFGRYAIPHLMYYLSGIMLAIFLIDLFLPGAPVQSLLALDMGLVAQGQIWRLITFIFFSVLDFIQSLFLLSTGQRFGKRMGSLSVQCLLSLRRTRVNFGRMGHRLWSQSFFEFVPFFSLCCTLSRF